MKPGTSPDRGVRGFRRRPVRLRGHLHQATQTGRRMWQKERLGSASCSCFQLLLEFVEKPPVGALGDEFLRARLDHPELVQPQGVEAQGVFWVGLAPARVGQAFENFQPYLIAWLV